MTCLEQETLWTSSDAVYLVFTPRLCPTPFSLTTAFYLADETDDLVVFAGEIGLLRKGADVLHRAWRLVARRRPEARCPDGGSGDRLCSPAAERLEVRPSVGPIEMKEILRCARVVALPARAEGMPMVLTEAMSVGRPFVSTPVGGIPDLAGAGGVLVAVDDEIDLANRLTDLLSNPGLARTIGERGRRFCLETRSVEVIDARLRKLYSAQRLPRRINVFRRNETQRSVSGARTRRIIVNPYLANTPTPRPRRDLARCFAPCSACSRPRPRVGVAT